MTILASLARAYERLPDKPPFGYEFKDVKYVIGLNSDGSVASVSPIGEGKSGRRLLVPAPPKDRSGSAIRPAFLWDNTKYALGVTSIQKPKESNDDYAKRTRRLPDTHIAFANWQRELLSGTTDEGLCGLIRFLDTWNADHFSAPNWPNEMRDANIVFALEGNRRSGIYLHDLPEAKEIWRRANATGNSKQICLVSGESGPIARLHTDISGVWNAQSAGAPLVSFNASAYESYGHEQGDNAPVSETAAFAYTTALNVFLAKDSRNRIQIGDASTVFWADASDAETAETAHEILLAGFSDIDETKQSERVRAVLEGLRNGRPLSELDPRLETGVRFYVLGLAPNAARISIRFWYESDFSGLARNYQRFALDMRIEPPARTPFPPLWQYLSELAALKKRENVPPNLAGEWMRAILTGNRYPHTLLNGVLMRIRADGDVNALRTAMLKAVLIRNFDRKDTPLALDPQFKDKGYLLGRLFAVYERIQESALGRNVNSTIKDKFYGSASAQPRKVFAAIDRNSANHLSKVAKQAPGHKVNLERTLSDIMGSLSPADDPFPASLSAQEQALFGLGYYHQRSAFFQSRDQDASETAQ